MVNPYRSFLPLCISNQYFSTTIKVSDLRSSVLSSLTHDHEFEIKVEGQGHVINFWILRVIVTQKKLLQLMIWFVCQITVYKKAQLQPISVEVFWLTLIGVFSPYVFEISISPQPYKWLTWGLLIWDHWPMTLKLRSRSNWRYKFWPLLKIIFCSY